MPDAMSRGADAVPQEGDFTFGAEHVHADYWCAACIEEGHRRAALSVPAPTHEHNGKPCSCGVPAPTLPALDAPPRTAREFARWLHDHACAESSCEGWEAASSFAKRAWLDDANEALEWLGVRDAV